MFRTKYLDYAELTRQLHEWSEMNPGLVRVTSLGKSAEGRDIPLLTIGRNPDEARPAVWIDGNMHATELCGSSVAMAIAEDVIRLHHPKSGSRGTTAQERGLGLPAHMVEAIKDALFYIVPRISPDGAEQALKTGRYVRSSPIDQRRHKGHAYWESHDFDGDGTMGFMRQASDEGELVALAGLPNVMIPRQPEDPPPYYKLYPEARIVNFDGHRIPDPYFLSDNQYDFNRNFPYSWAPEPEQEGAGDYPGSAPETRAILNFVTEHPEIMVWLNLHTFGGVLIRPLGDKPDNKMDQADLAVYRQVEAWAKEITGYPTVSGFHEFLYEPETPLRGDLTEYAYHQRGCIAYVIELWDLFHQLGIETKKPFVDHYTRLERKDFEALAKWDLEVNHGRVFKPWRKVRHPQLGEVEVGGLDLLVGITNPPFEKLAEVCEKQSAAFLRVAALVPRVHIEVLAQEKLGSDLTRIELRIVNRGYLGTYGPNSAKKLPHSEPLRLTTECTGLRLAAPGESVIEIGHLDGWGRGLYNGPTIFAPWTRGNIHEKFVTLVAEGHGKVKVTAGSCRVGYRSVEIAVLK
ncbi:MAG TPA: M14 family metallopeptidase [Usitatibacter sp.]|nr:M14 family metallopeptidase [Usitatibacter sp.]